MSTRTLALLVQLAATTHAANAAAIAPPKTPPPPSPEAHDAHGAAPPTPQRLRQQHAAAPALAHRATQALYDAYNQLHTYSQQSGLTIDSPAVVVVGRQTDGKSALIEALMGFQFNHVGGGTKTRRPTAMRRQ